MLLMLVSVVKTPDPSLALALGKHRFGLPVKAITWGSLLNRQGSRGGQKQVALKIILEVRMEKAGVDEAVAGCADWLPDSLGSIARLG